MVPRPGPSANQIPIEAKHETRNSRDLMMLRPRPLEARSVVAVVAPSGPFDHTLCLRGLGWLAQHHRLSWTRELFSQQGFLAGSDERRLTELQAALDDPEVEAIVAARGGYGLTRITHRLNWDATSKRPRWLVGFSDFTALHLEAQSRGLVSLHGANVAGLGRGDSHHREAWLSALRFPERPLVFSGLERWAPGQAEGPLWGGNLTLVANCVLSGRLRLPSGALLFLEEVAEAPYAIDRTLTALGQSGQLAQLGGVVLGEFTGCRGRYGVPVEAVLREHLTRLGVPVLAGLPIGHGRRNNPLRLGAMATIGGDRLIVA